MVRLLRGGLAAVLAVGSAVLAHSAAGHHSPHGVVMLLSVIISVPVCVALSSVKFSRPRLLAAVLSSQGVLHGLFALFPASGSYGSATVQSGGSPGHQHHHEHLIVETAGHQSVSVMPDASMGLSHLAAAIVTYTLLRRGELVLHALSELWGIHPVLLLADTRPPVALFPRQPVPSTRIPLLLRDLWPGAGPRTLRGPPVAAS